MKNLYSEILFKKDNIEIISIKEFDIIKIKNILYSIINIITNNLQLQTVDLGIIKLYNIKIILYNNSDNLSINIHMKSNIFLKSSINDYIEIPFMNISIEDILDFISKINNEEVLSLAIESYSNTGIYINRKEVKENAKY